MRRLSAVSGTLRTTHIDVKSLPDLSNSTTAPAPDCRDEQRALDRYVVAHCSTVQYVTLQTTQFIYFFHSLSFKRFISLHTTPHLSPPLHFPPPNPVPHPPHSPVLPSPPYFSLVFPPLVFPPLSSEASSEDTGVGAESLVSITAVKGQQGVCILLTGEQRRAGE